MGGHARSDTGMLAPMTMHAGQLSVPIETVRRLVAEQFPQWGELSIRPLASAGTVNALFRIGDHLTGRFPLHPIELELARQWLREEAEAARELAGRTAYATPEPVAIGEPGAGYPLPWSVQTWVPGTAAAEDDLSASVAFARDLAAFIGGVRSIDTRGRTFARAGRGGDLRNHDAWMRECFAHSEDLVDVPRLRQIWAGLRDLPRTSPDVMTHGDLTPGNVLVADGRLAGVIDVGGLGPADPALDLVAAWHLLQSGPREVLRADLGVDDLEWRRGQAWALEQAMGVVWYYVDTNPAMHRMGHTTLQRILDS
jgi:aminoglycoside phosphotransferase (APT) family kinase protein